MLKRLYLGVLLLLGGCAGWFAVPYDSPLDVHATSAYGTAAKIAAEIQLGQLTTADSYARTTDQYASLMSDIAIAVQQAQGLQTHSSVAEDNKKRLIDILTACSAQTQTLAGLQKSSGLQPNAGAENGMMTTCSEAAKAAAAMKP